MIAVGTALVFSAGGYSLYTRALDRPGVAPLPVQFAGLDRIRETGGKQAVAEINHLHGKSFPLTSAAVGIYGNKQEATLWVSGVPSGLFAGRILASMRARISEGRSPFTPAGDRPDGRRVIYALDGMGQKHFYFQSKNLVIWLAADESVAEKVLEQALEFFP